MRKRITALLLSVILVTAAYATTYYVAPSGSDAAAGTIDAPFATLAKAQSLVKAGDTVYLRGGTYTVTADQTMSQWDIYDCVFMLDKSGTAEAPICYYGYEDERPVFDFSQVRPEERRVSAFFIKGDYLHLKNFDITGVQVTITTHTQSECISMRGGSNCIIENIAMHDGMAIGVYMTKGKDNLILNCDAYNNDDTVSAESGKSNVGENVDGFGAHLEKAEYTGNRFVGCRAWYNSDDGFDLINNYAPVVIDHCIAFKNGYNTSDQKRGNGIGIKAGGYALKTFSESFTVPRNVIKNCIAVSNKQYGFYANHHLGGCDWLNCSAAYNGTTNYCMVNQKSFSENVDVDGYDHVIKNCLNYSANNTYKNIDASACTLENNTFLPETYAIAASDFKTSPSYKSSTLLSLLAADRNSDGSLPTITYLTLATTSELYTRKVGFEFDWDEVSNTDPKSVFIYAGQSNCDGRDTYSNMPSYLITGSTPYAPYSTKLHYAYIAKGTDGTFGSRVFPMDGASQYNNRYAFCDITNYWIDKSALTDFYCVKCSYGDTAIDPSSTLKPTWYADATWLTEHNAFVSESDMSSNAANNSLAKSLTEGFSSLVDQTLAAVEHGYKVKAIMWHQGEGDRNASANYYQNFKTLIAYLRGAIYAKTGDEDARTLPFIFGTVSRKSKQYNKVVEKAQLQVAAEDDNVYAIDMSKGTLLSDGLHFDQQGCEYLGRMMYNKLVELGLVEGSAVEVTPFPVAHTALDDVEVSTPDARQWDFTQWSEATSTLLETETALSEGAKWDWNKNYGYRFTGSTENTELYAVSTSEAISELEGLFFTGTASRVGIIPNSKSTNPRLVLVGSDITLQIPKVHAGEIITITTQTGKSGEARGIVPNMDSEAYLERMAGDETSTAKQANQFRVVSTLEGTMHVGFEATGGLYVYDITITDEPTVTIGESHYATYCPSHALDFSESEVKAYTAVTQDGVVKLTQQDIVPAGTGVVLYAENAGDYEIPLTIEETTVNDNEMIGVLERTLVEWSTGDDGKYNYILQQGVFNKATSGGYLPANRAYLHTSYDVTSTGNAHPLQLVFDGGTTGISSVESRETRDESYYTLDGRRLNGMPNKSGFYIVNGRKVVIK